MNYLDHPTYGDGVLMGNWFEEQIGNYALQTGGNKDSVYQSDYRQRVTPVRDDRIMRQMREKAMGLPVELIREHGPRGSFDRNTCTVYDLNCASAFCTSPTRRYNARTGLWLPERSFADNYGPGRVDRLAERSREAESRADSVPDSEYRCSFR